MGLRERLSRLERLCGPGREVHTMTVLLDHSREPTQAERRAAIEAHVAEHGETEIIVLFWEGDRFR